MNHMHKLKTILLNLSALATVAAAGGAGAAPRELLPEQAGDLSPSAVLAPAAAAAAPSLAGAPQPSHDAVALSWASADAIAPLPAPHLAQSRQSYVSVTGAQLAAGVPLHTTSSRALVRVQALDAASPREALAIHPLSMTLTDSAGKRYEAGAGMEQLVTDDKLNKAELPFAPGTSAFRLHRALGKGTFKLSADGVSGEQRYLINVVEPDSPYTLTMQAGATHYLHGQTLALQADLREGDANAPTRHPVSKLTGVVVSPAGRQFPVTFRSGAGGLLRASVALDANEAPAPGLWEVRADAQATVQGQVVQRSLRLAFPVAMPVAKLDRSVTLVESTGGVRLNVGVQTAAAGRYEVRGLLYGTVNGALAPLGVADAAQWLEAGGGSIALTFAPELIAGASGPFELRDLFLLDQGRMGVLQHQQRALVLSEDEVVRAGGRSARAGALAQAAPRVKRAPDAQTGASR